MIYFPSKVIQTKVHPKPISSVELQPSPSPLVATHIPQAGPAPGKHWLVETS